MVRRDALIQSDPWKEIEGSQVEPLDSDDVLLVMQ